MSEDKALETYRIKYQKKANLFRTTVEAIWNETPSKSWLDRQENPVWLSGNTTRAFKRAGYIESSGPETIKDKLGNSIHGCSGKLLRASRISDTEERAEAKLLAIEGIIWPQRSNGEDVHQGIKLKIIDLFLKHAAFSIDHTCRSGMTIDVPLDKIILDELGEDVTGLKPGSSMGAITSVGGHYVPIQDKIKKIEENGFIFDFVVWNSRSWFVEGYLAAP
jgi:hypothetical protein